MKHIYAYCTELMRSREVSPSNQKVPVSPKGLRVRYIYMNTSVDAPGTDGNYRYMACGCHEQKCQCVSRAELGKHWVDVTDCWPNKKKKASKNKVAPDLW